jgi:hypothetical protein
MSVRSRLNGYTVPTAVIAVLVSLAGLAMMNACTRIAALEADAAAEQAWRQTHMEMSIQRIEQIDRMQVGLDQIHGIVGVLKDRSDRLERERIREQGQ